MSRIRLLALTLITAALLLGCDSNNGIEALPGQGGDLVWSFQGLEPLGGGFVYEGWIIVDGAPVSVGRFNLDGTGTPDLAGDALSADEFENAAAFVLTIEPGAGDDPAPSDTKLLGGPIVDQVAMLSIDHPAALADDFSSAAGAFILQTPTTSGIPDDYNQGIWYLDPAAGPGPALQLPTLPAGWAYEGWIVDGSGPISTGRFSGASGADSDGDGADSGPDPGPPFPGQDFITPPLDLVGLTAVITVEPEPDDSPAPFLFKPLVDATIEDVGPGVLQSMANRADTAPTGRIDLN